MNKLKSKQTLTLLITICKIHPNNEIRNQNLSPSNKSHYIYLYIFLRRCTYIGLRSFCKVPSAMAVPLGALKTSTIFLPTLSLHWFQRLWKQLYVCLNTKLEINLGFNITSLPINFMFTSMYKYIYKIWFLKWSAGDFYFYRVILHTTYVVHTSFRHGKP